MRGGTTFGIGRKLANPSSFSISTQTLAPFSTQTLAPFSTSSNGGGGRGRGRGGPFPAAPSLFNHLVEQFPDQPDSVSSTGAGHGRGTPLSQPPPPFGSGIRPGAPAGRGHPGHVRLPGESREGDDSGLPKKPVFFRREDAAGKRPEDILTALGVTGRGKPVSGSAVQSVEEDRRIGAPVEPRKPKLSREDAVKHAMGILHGGGDEGPEVVDGGGGGGGGGRGRGGERGMGMMRESGGERGMGVMRGRGGGRGRGMRGRGGGRGRGGRGRRDGEGDRRRGGEEDGGIASGLYLGDNADGEKLAEKLGPEVMNQLTEAFEDMSTHVLPSPLDDAYVDALDTNCKIEFEPEYLMGEFNQNPDIDEKPPIPLRDALEKMKPFLMAYEGIQSQEEWEEAIKETMERVPLLKKIVDHYSGPDRVTAKKQREELERVAKTLPANVPDSVKQFTDRAVLSLQGNPGWGFHRKCQFMDKLTQKVSKHYK